jgi:transcription termination factor Rho
MMDFNNLVRNKMNRNLLQDDQRQNAAKEALEKSVVKKMQTVMIGALASVEQQLGFLWGHNENRHMTDEELELKSLFDKIRSEILDKGNGQIRNFKQELEGYKVEPIKVTVQLPVIPN